MKKVLQTVALFCFALMGMAQTQTKSATLIIKQSTKYQYMDGFGGTGMNGQWADVYTQEKVRKLWGKGERQIGLNIMRVRINPNEGNWGEYGNPIRWARNANPDLQVFATPWTPPKKYKTSKSSIYQNDFGTDVWPLVEHEWGGQGSNGGAINPAYYEEYADFLERYRKTMEQKGCPIDMISIQNESDYTPTGDDHVKATYESCIYSPKEMAAMVKAARKAVDPKCKIMGPECFGWDQHKYNNTLVNMKDAVDNIDVWGNHLYGTNDWSFVKNVTNKTGKHMWMTEFLIDYPKSGYTGQFSTEHDMVKSIEQAIASGYSAYVYYNMLDDFFAVNHGGSDTELWKRAYVFGHYAKHATGKTRVLSTLTDDDKMLVGGSSFLSTTGDTLTLFLLNTSSTYAYNVVTQLPFVPQRVKQMVTNDVVNMLTKDVTEQYAKGSKFITLKLMPNTFYTFQFVRNVPEDEEPEVVAIPKQAAYANPLSANLFMADPTSVEYDGRLYVYATNDQQQFDDCDGLKVNDYGKITSLVCMSTADFVNWTNHGTIDVKAIAPWISKAWAPSVVSREEADGKTHFYLYFTNGGGGIGVLTSTSPTGPWTDPLGKALIDGRTTGLGKISSIIDPGVCIKPDGSEAYLTFGGGDVTGTNLQPGNARIVKLGDDMMSLASDIKTISAPCHFEANELNYIGSRWVYSYCTRWSLPSADEWKSFSKTKTAPTACSIVYMTTKGDPLEDAWIYQGEIMPNPGKMGYPSGNNHAHIQKFGTGMAYYLLYHTQWLENQLGYTGGYRNLQMNRLILIESTAKVSPMTASTANINGLSQLAAARVNPYESQSGKMAAIATKDWWMVRGVNFGINGNTARSLILKVKGTGTLEVRLGSQEAEPIATADFSGTEEQSIVVPVAEEQSALQQYVYFMYTNNTDAEVLSWQFSPLSADEATAIVKPSVESRSTETDEWHTLTGVKLSTRPSERGIYIHNGEKVIVE